MNESIKQTDWSYIKRLAGFLKGEKSLLISIAFILVAYGFAQAYAPTIIAKIIDENLTQKDAEGLLKNILFLIAIYTFLLISFRAQLTQLGKLGENVLFRIRSTIFKAMQGLNINFYHQNEPGDLMSRLINDTGNLGTLFSQSIAQTLGSVASLFAIIIAMFLLDWRLAISTFLVIPVMAWLTFYFSKKSRVAFQKSSASLGDLSSTIEEELRVVRESQSFAREAVTIQDFKTDNAYNRDANIEAIRITAAFTPSIDILSTIAQIIVIVYGSYLAFKGLTTVGVIVAFLAYSQRFYRPIQMLASFYTQLQKSLASAERVFSVIDSPKEPLFYKPEIQIDNIKGDIAFDQVTFAYNDGQKVLNNVSFEVKAGQSIALIGETGVGKSTCINLIPRYYEVQNGRVLIDGKNVNHMHLRSLREYIAEVPQSSFLFSDSITNNIAYGDPNPNTERVILAAKSAQAHDFIEKLKNGYESRIGSDGVHLSNGQMQLISIARAIYADPKILLLDEATSKIDSKTEKKLQHAINEILKGRTSVIIAHRLSTIRNADKILVLGKEGIIETGNHNQLLAQGGYYAKLIEKEFE